MRGNLKVAPMLAVVVKLIGNRIGWFGHIKKKEETPLCKKVMSINLDGWKGIDRPKK